MELRIHVIYLCFLALMVVGAITTIVMRRAPPVDSVLLVAMPEFDVDSSRTILLARRVAEGCYVGMIVKQPRRGSPEAPLTTLEPPLSVLESVYLGDPLAVDAVLALARPSEGETPRPPAPNQPAARGVFEQ